MNALIYSVCFGSRCRNLAAAQISSIKKIGKWERDILILGDDQALSLRDDQVSVINIVPAAEKIFQLPYSSWTGANSKNTKPLLPEFFDISRYDYLLYLDVDILINTSRLNSIVDSLYARNCISVQRDIASVSANMSYTGRDVLTPEEKQIWKDCAICSGIVGMRTDALGRGLMEHWQAANAAANFQKSDQGNLIAVLIRKYPDKWDYIGDTVMGRQLAPYAETFVHFSARKDELLYRYYADILRLSLS